ncbi:unnamed protein product, partial [Discosporangium mesarthrocarpum]
VAKDIWQPTIGLTWNWQLQFDEEEGIDTSIEVDVFDIDLFDVPQATINELHDKGKKVVCYFSAGTWEDWRDDAGKFKNKVKGENLADWEGEKWLDITHKARSGVRKIMKKRLKTARDKNCDGVEPDNVMVYAEGKETTGFKVTAKEQRNYDKYLIKKAHKYGLAIAMKNDIDHLEDLHEDFDFAINESCIIYNECAGYTDTFLTAGKPVFHAEYKDDNTSGNKPEFCDEVPDGFSSIFKVRDGDD